MYSTQQLISRHIPIPNRNSNRGWKIFCGVCCHHRGHKADTRFRGNLLFDGNHTAYNCYNCGFRVVFDETSLSLKGTQLLQWLGIEQLEINELKLLLLKNKIDGIIPEKSKYWVESVHNFVDQPLPPDAHDINYWLSQGQESEDFYQVLDYLYNNRGESLAQSYDYYWSPNTKGKSNMNNRLIIPFYYQNRIVGWSARHVLPNPPKDIPRYWNSQIPEGYFFNFDSMHRRDRKYCLIHEGPFDAIATDGIAVLGSEFSKEQLHNLNNSDKIKIVVPDRQRKNQGLIDQALLEGWYVSFPDWEDDVKDAADAAKRYGRLYTLKSILDSKTNNSTMINVKRKMYRR